MRNSKARQWILRGALSVALAAAASFYAVPGISLAIAAPDESLALDLAIFSQPFYKLGDEVVLELDAGADGASVTADFSALDSAYRAGDESVTGLGKGRYEVRYRVSTGNTRPAGDYMVALRLDMGGDSTAIAHRLGVTYLPLGYGEITLRQGRFVAGDRTSEQNTSTLEVSTELRQDGRRLKSNTIDPTRPFELALSVTSDRPLDPEALDVELYDSSRSGYWRAQLALTNERCGKRGCTYEALATLAIDPGLVGESASADRGDLSIQVVSHGGAVSFPTHQPKPNYTAKDWEDTHRVSGTIRFQWIHRQPDDYASGMEPWKRTWREITYSKPASFVSIVLEDECGSYITGETGQFGSFSFGWKPVGCDLAWITVRSSTNHSSLYNASVGRWLNGPVSAARAGQD